MSFHSLIAHFILRTNNITLSGYATVCLSIHLLGCYQILAVLNKDKINMMCSLCVYIFNSFGEIQRSAIAEAYDKSMLSFVRNYQNLPRWLYHSSFPPAMKEISCCPISSQHLVLYMCSRFWPFL